MDTLSEVLPAGVSDRTWGVLSAVSEGAKNRSQGQHMFLTMPEHTLGRAVKDSAFAFDSQSISGRHCRIYRKTIAGDDGQSAIAVFIKDSSSNGTYVNNQRLRRDSPELRLQEGDIISLAALPEQENGFAYIFRDTSSGLKRKPEAELSKADDGKRMKMSGPGPADGPVNLADVRRLERSNQELRQKLELECNKYDSLNADLRAAKFSTESMVKEAVDQCTSVYNQKVADLQSELSLKSSALEESSAKCTQQESVIDDLQNRLKAAAQSRMEAEEAVENFKANRAELEKQLDNERNQFKKERQEAEAQHKAAIDRIRMEADEESHRQTEAFSRQRKQLEDKMIGLQESVSDYRVQIENQRKQLEEEREIRMNVEKRGQELQIQLNIEQNASTSLRQEVERSTQELERSRSTLEAFKLEKNDADAKIALLQLEKEEIANKLQRESQRFEGARDRILLRETQLRSFQSTAEEIGALQQKQQVQLQAMMKTLKDDDAEYANAANAGYVDGDDHSESKTVDEDMKDAEVTKPDDSAGTHVNGTQVRTFLGNATLDLNEMAEETSGGDNTMIEVAPTQLDPIPTQLDATQLIPLDFNRARDRQDDPAMMETQVLPPGDGPGAAPGTPMLDRNEESDDDPGQEPQTPLRTRSNRDRRQLQLRRSSLCTADLITSEVLGSDQDEEENQGERRVLASQVGNSDSLQVRIPINDTAAVTIETLGSQSSKMKPIESEMEPIEAATAAAAEEEEEEEEDSQDEPRGDTQEEAAGRTPEQQAGDETEDEAEDEDNDGSETDDN